LPPVPVGIIAAVAYHPDNPDARPKTISKAEATTFLLDNTIPMLKAPWRSLAAASQATRNALCLGGARPEASGFARELLHSLLLVMHEHRQPDFPIELNDIGLELLGSSHLAPPQLSEASPQTDGD
jgi:hypothetical protein